MRCEFFYVLIDGTSRNDLSKQKIIHVTDKLSQANIAASSGVRENVYPIIFCQNVYLYNIIILF